MIMKKNVSCITVLILHVTGMLYSVDGHGYLKSPPQRSSAWRYGYNNPVNYDHNQLFCGGFKRQWETNDGLCGVCGDPYDGVKLNEAGNQTKYANGVITGNYTKGSLMDVTVKITANHMGWFEFRLCANNNPQVPVTQACLNRTLLPLTNHGTRFNVTSAPPREYDMKLQLPAEITCTQCVLQWKYYTGNSWGCEASGCCVGCGKQETFVNCADIAIHDTTTVSTSPLTSTAQSVSTTTITTQTPSTTTTTQSTSTTTPSSSTTTQTTQEASSTTTPSSSTTTQTMQDASSTTTPSTTAQTTQEASSTTTPSSSTTTQTSQEASSTTTPSSSTTTQTTQEASSTTSPSSSKTTQTTHEASSTTIPSSSTTTQTTQEASSTTTPSYSTTTQTTQEASSSTTPSPSTTHGHSSTSRVPLTCKAVGVWVMVPGMHRWCENNCNHFPSYCPPTHCHCSTINNNYTIIINTCKAVGVWVMVPGMHKWCENNCSHSPSYCPPTHCQC